MCCNYLVERFHKRKIEHKRGLLRLQGLRKRDTLKFAWPQSISMDGFVRRKRPGYPYEAGFLQFAKKTKGRFTNLIETEIASLRNIKTQFGLLVKFFNHQRQVKQSLDHYFFQRGPPSIFNKNNKATIEDVFIPWSQSGSGWVIEVFSLEAFLNVAV